MFKNINIIMRISKYKKALTKLKAMGFDKVFSDNLADSIGINASQVRKDFSVFGISGNKRGGYQIETLIKDIDKIIGKKDIQNLILVGLGNMGNALLKYKRFKDDNINISAVFESDSNKINRFGIIPVLPVEEMKSFVEENNILMGIITVPDSEAQAVFEIMIKAGIKGVINFTSITLKTTEDIYISNVDLIQEIDAMIYFVNEKDKNK